MRGTETPLGLGVTTGRPETVASSLTTGVGFLPAAPFPPAALPGDSRRPASSGGPEGSGAAGAAVAPSSGRRSARFLGREPGLVFSSAGSMSWVTLMRSYLPLSLRNSTPSSKTMVVGQDVTPRSLQRSLYVTQLMVAKRKS